MPLLTELWKKGTVPPMQDDIPEGGIAIDVAAKKMYSKANDGTIFEIGGFSGVHNDLGGRDASDAHPLASITGLQGELSDRYTKSEFIDTSTGAADAGKPIVLDANGKIDVSMLDTSTFYYVGAHDPSGGTEYPDTTGESHGAFWVVDTIGTPNDGSDYTFQSGDLAGKTISVGDFMVWGAGGWGIMAGEMNPNLYYKLDGTQAITGPFAGGGQQIKNIAVGTEAGDGIEFNQFNTALATKANEADIDIGVY